MGQSFNLTSVISFLAEPTRFYLKNNDRTREAFTWLKTNFYHDDFARSLALSAKDGMLCLK